LSQEGNIFADHHPVYLSSTEVNGTALATGSYPLHSGVMANHEYRPAIELLKPINTENDKAVRKGDQASGGKYLRMPTIAEMLRRAGLRTVVAGTKPVALLLDRDAPGLGTQGAGSVTLFQGRSVPSDALDATVLASSPFPEVADARKSANLKQDGWTTRILIERLWAGDIPAFTFLWMSEPDYAQHGSGPGSAVARAALRSNDANLATVLAALESSKVRDKTDVLVVSDHGFSTISRSIDMIGILSGAGFDAVKRFDKTPAPGQVLVVGSGGSVLLYVMGHDRQIIKRLAAFLQKSDFAGVIFTRTATEGTFPLDRVKIDTIEAPDIVVSMRWSDDRSKTGLAGLLCSEGDKLGPGQGNHGSLSRFDMHNTLIANGPDFRRGYIDELPSGNDDVAPTVLHIIGVKA
jgi:arylsulfatase A-like enzyme